jgi:predicted lipoprotein
MRRLSICLLFAALSSSLHAADQSVVAKQQLFQHLTEDVLLPLTGDFAQAAGKLAAASQSFCAGQSNLRSVQAAWRDVQSAWQPLEMLQIGPTIERRTQRQINSWPVRPKLLQPLLAESAPIDPQRVETIGAAGKGLSAIEYLLFDKGESAAASKKNLASIHCNALQALAMQVKSEADGLAADWREPDGFARQLAQAGQPQKDSPFASADQALSDVVNLLIAGIDAVKIRKLGKPLEKSADEAALDRIESWRSGTSLDHIRDNLRGFELAFFGAGKDGIGIDDYLVAIERPGLARVIRRELDTTKKALAAIRPPLQNALLSQRKKVAALHKSVSSLQYMLETEVADALKIDLGFNANDGD